MVTSATNQQCVKACAPFVVVYDLVVNFRFSNMVNVYELDIDAPGVSGKQEKYSDFLKKKILSEFKFTPEQVDEIANVFIRFEGDLTEGYGEGRMENKYIKVFLRALGLDPSTIELTALIEEVDVDNTGSISLNQFGELLQKVMRRKSNKLELLRAYRLFDEDSKGYISTEDLRRAAAAAGETMCDAELEELLSAADASKTGVVMKKDFFNFMKTVHYYIEEI